MNARISSISAFQALGSIVRDARAIFRIGPILSLGIVTGIPFLVVKTCDTQIFWRS